MRRISRILGALVIWAGCYAPLSASALEGASTLWELDAEFYATQSFYIDSRSTIRLETPENFAIGCNDSHIGIEVICDYRSFGLQVQAKISDAAQPGTYRLRAEIEVRDFRTNSGIRGQPVQFYATRINMDNGSVDSESGIVRSLSLATLATAVKLQPSVPRDFKSGTARHSDEIYLHWRALNQSQQYRVYRCSGWALHECFEYRAATTASMYYPITDIWANYYFRLRACNASGCSAYSDALYARANTSLPSSNPSAVTVHTRNSPGVVSSGQNSAATYTMRADRTVVPDNLRAGGENTKLKVQATVVPQSTHRNRHADIYMVLNRGSEWFYVNTQGQLVRWNERLSTLQPRLTDRVLASSNNYMLLNDLAINGTQQNGRYSIFIGYSPQNDANIYYSSLPLVFSVINR